MTNDLMPVNQDLHNRIVSSYILPTYCMNSKSVHVILSLYRKYKCFIQKQILLDSVSRLYFTKKENYFYRKNNKKFKHYIYMLFLMW